MDDSRRRKDDHIRTCLEHHVEVQGPGGITLDDFRFEHQALPETSFSEVDTSVRFLGHRLEWPFIVGSMTGGTKDAAGLNLALAKAAARSGSGMALGSLRPALDDPGLLATFDVRRSVPDLPLLLGNIGGAQLADRGVFDPLLDACARLSLDGLIVHLNPLQELLQPGGDTDFCGIADAVEELSERMHRELALPVGVKEVGSGISASCADRLRGIDFIETAGVGGTSWIRVEGIRNTDPIRKRCADTLAAWGQTTAESLLALRSASPRTPLVASGGIRNGLHVAVAIRLGATVCAMALPLLRAARRGTDDLDFELDAARFELRAVMFATGSRNLDELAHAPLSTGPGKYAPWNQ